MNDNWKALLGMLSISKFKFQLFEVWTKVKKTSTNMINLMFNFGKCAISIQIVKPCIPVVEAN